MSKTRISHKQKIHSFPLIIKRDGNICIYCEKGFTKNRIVLTLNPSQKRVWEHLNNDEYDNRLENLAFAHEGCNYKKKTDPDMQIKAMEKLKKNEQDAELTESHLDTLKETTAEMDSNAEGLKMTLNYLREQLEPRGNNPPYESELRVKEVCDLLAGRMFKMIGHGSQESIRRHIDILTTSDWEFQKYKDEGRWYISLRFDEDDI